MKLGGDFIIEIIWGRVEDRPKKRADRQKKGGQTDRHAEIRTELNHCLTTPQHKSKLAIGCQTDDNHAEIRVRAYTISATTFLL